MKLGVLDPGTLFKKGDCYALKSEYRTEKGICESYIIGSGEMFYGSTGNPNALKVEPIDFVLLIQHADENARLHKALEGERKVKAKLGEKYRNEKEVNARLREALQSACNSLGADVSDYFEEVSR